MSGRLLADSGSPAGTVFALIVTPIIAASLDTAGTIPGILRVYVSGMILAATGSWVLVFQLAAAVTLFGLICFLLMASGRKQFD